MSVSTGNAGIDWTSIQSELLGKRDQKLLPPWVKLPSLPSAIMECVQKSQDPDVAPRELGEIIEKDSGLTCLLLRHVNSAASGFQHKARTAPEAITRLGIRKSVHYLVTVGMNEVMKSCKSKLINFQGFWCSNLERSLFAREVARLLKTDEELAFAGAMLSDCLLPLVTNSASRTYLRFLSLEEKTRPRLVEFEDKEFSWDHPTATALLIAGWGFPADLVCCVYLHHKGLDLLKHPQLRQTAAAAVAISGLLPDQLFQETHGLKLLARLQAAWPQFDLQQIAERVQERFAELAPGTQNPFPLQRRLGRVLSAAH